MKVYRFVHLTFPEGLSAEGARRHGGRWNSKGVAALYCATSESLALLELRVHSPHPVPQRRLKFVIEVPDDAITQADRARLPRGWNKVPPGPESKRFGDAWLAAQSSLGLLVPSVIATEEHNLVLNPQHPRFTEVRIASKQTVTIDKRLYEPVAKARKPAKKK